MKMTRPLDATMNKDMLLDQEFLVQFVSFSFKKDFLDCHLLVSQGMFEFDPDNAELTKTFGSESVSVEDLMFRKITQEKLSEY